MSLTKEQEFFLTELRQKQDNPLLIEGVKLVLSIINEQAVTEVNQAFPTPIVIISRYEGLANSIFYHVNCFLKVDAQLRPKNRPIELFAPGETELDVMTKFCQYIMSQGTRFFYYSKFLSVPNRFPKGFFRIIELG